ncbi:hypothetical protein ASPSYDRAFT_334390 [Aspergillus sydowii CBS 593.65]|uniref:Uncharacterized protein n=1 Tax=Aspergillus sydowii CBS 593.65 TaxID=1036612 RepID=A0A1L9TYT7_9EURO|nr:uncharacterized protein ASPSYDRAFT_334390 [Aspergillus sydowii CBS 593.65]OJJ64579.1 hypothetical protein ASPSYDRAFT_334390 [Aspergillus sydowii CBS 593.65]
MMRHVLEYGNPIFPSPFSSKGSHNPEPTLLIPNLRAWSLHPITPSLYSFSSFQSPRMISMTPTSPVSPCQPKFTARVSLDSLTTSFRPISRGSQASAPQSLHGHHSTEIHYPPEFSNDKNGRQTTGSERGSGNSNGNNGGGGTPPRGGTGGQGGSGRGGSSNEGDDSGSDANHGAGNDDDNEASDSQSGESGDDDRKADDGNDHPGMRKSRRVDRRPWEHVNDQAARYMAPTKHAFKRMSGKAAAWVAKGKAKVNGHT